MNSESIFLDAWALLAWLQGEQAGAVVRDLVEQAEKTTTGTERQNARDHEIQQDVHLCLNEINLGETHYIVGRRKGEEFAESIVSRIQNGPFDIVSPDWDLVKRASIWKIHHSISFADAFAVATADRRNARLATGDPELQNLSGLDLLWLPEQTEKVIKNSF